MKGKSTKSALLMSFTSLLLCFAMLIGCTFAWFTDTVTSGVNTIQAGNLDIEVEYKNQASGGWKNLEGSTTVFSHDLWEPGHTEFVTLKITNKGTLALKYQMNVSPINERGGINKAGNSFKLSDHLVFGTTAPSTNEPSYDRASARNAVKTNGNEVKGLKPNDLTKENNMESGETQYITLVVYMPVDVDNVANYKTGTTAPEIELSIKFIATQLGSENETGASGYVSYAEDDSFGKDYDNNVYYQAIDTVVTYNYFPQTKQVAQLVKNGNDKADKGDDGDTHVGKVESTISISSDATFVDETEQKPYAKVSFADTAVNFGEGTNATVTLNAEKKEEGNIHVEGTDMETVTYDVSVLSDKPWNGGTLFTVQLFIGAGKQGVSLTHKGDSDVPMKTVGDDGYVPGTADTFTYDSATGYVTMLVNHFSDFVAQYNAPVAAVGTTAYYSVESAVEAAKATSETDTAKTVALIRNVQSATISESVPVNLNGKKVENLTVAANNVFIDDASAGKEGTVTTLKLAEGAEVDSILVGDSVTVTEPPDIPEEKIGYVGGNDDDYEAEINGSVKYKTLATAIKAAKENDTVTLLKDIYLEKTIDIPENKSVTFNGNGKFITVEGTGGKAAFGNTKVSTEGLKGTTSLTVENTNFKSSTLGANYAVITGSGFHGEVKLYHCSFTCMHTAVLMNSNGETAAALSITECAYNDTTWGYSVDNVTGTANVDVTFANNSGIDADKEFEVFSGKVAVIKSANALPRQFNTLKDAIAAAPGNAYNAEATNIVLMNDTNGGYDIDNGRNIVLDLNGKTLTLGPAIGSANTETNGMRVLYGNKLVLKNGIVKCSDIANDQGKKVKIGLANYDTAVLEDVDFQSGTYVIGTINNAGNLTLKGNTTIGEYQNTDSADNPGYPRGAILNGPYWYAPAGTNSYLNVADGSVKVGTVYVSKDGNDGDNDSSNWTGKAVINISAGTFGEFKVDGTKNLAEYTITGGVFGSNPTEYLGNGYIAVENEEGLYTIEIDPNAMDPFDKLIVALTDGSIAVPEKVTVNSPTQLEGKNGQPVKLSNVKTTINLNSILSVDKGNFDGFNDFGAMRIQDNSEITFTGSEAGKFVMSEFNEVYSLIYSESNFKLTFESGTFETAKHLFAGNFMGGSDTSGQYITINGGTFKFVNASKDSPIPFLTSDPNGRGLICASPVPAHITVTGGTFYNCDPTNYVAVGYKVTSTESGSDIIYTVAAE